MSRKRKIDEVRYRRQLSLPETIVQYHEGRGVKITSSSRMTPKKPPNSGGIRGKIGEWSFASRHRMRMALLELRPKDQAAMVFGVTFTIPGKQTPTDHESRELWQGFCARLDNLRLPMIWRCERQKRGALHWHGIIYASPVITASRAQLLAATGPGARRKYELETGYCVGQVWSTAVKALGPYSDDEQSGSSRMALTGADKHAFNVQTDETQAGQVGAWLRYLQDHSTKGKSEQLPEGIGRHWGIVGRRYLDRQSIGDCWSVLRGKQRHRFIRAIQRLATPSVRDEESVFGRRLGFRCRRGQRGNSVWFSNPETIKLLARWAASTSEEEELTPGKP